MYKYLSSCDIRNLKLILTCIFSLLFLYIFSRPVLSSIDSDSAANGRDRFFPPRWERRLVHTLTFAQVDAYAHAAPLEAACTGGS